MKVNLSVTLLHQQRLQQTTTSLGPGWEEINRNSLNSVHSICKVKPKKSNRGIFFKRLTFPEHGLQ